MQFARPMRSVLMLGLLLVALFAASLGIVTEPLKSSRPLIPDLKNPADLAPALSKLSIGERGDLTRREENIYLANPLNIAALQNLVVLRALDQRKLDAEAIAIALANFSRRSVTSQLSAVQIDLASQHYESALSRLDGVLRAQPALLKQLFPTFVALIQNPDSRAHFAEVLASSPPWRDAVFYQLNQVDKDGAMTYQLLTEIRKQKGTLLDGEKRSLIWKLIGAGQYNKAYFIWLDFLAPEELIKVQNVFDPGFTQEPKAIAFDWNLSNRPTARIAVVGKPGHSTDRILSLDFFEDRDGGAYVYQYLRLSQGDYVLSFEVKVDSLKNDQGLVWRIRCFETGAEVARSPIVKEAGPWEVRTIAFEVSAGCESQALELVNSSTAALDQKISGKLAFDNVAIRIRE